MKKILIGIALLAIFSFSIKPDKRLQKEINWLTITEAYKLNQKEPRKIFVDVYTNWCGWCKKMDKDTFSDPEVVDIVNEKFYAVKLNAESTEPITMAGDTTTAQIIARSMGVTGYPTIVYIKEDFKTIQSVPGYQNAQKFKNTLEKILAWE
ncbi:thioredoxin family protein [Marivirga sp.]|uniref:thioredoxin family protein n=1 Tax=Marivirga sp. TaxID=2018662 RepID=UPI002D80A9DE|nr:thioredoxin fold domain-containing protein [Marivirga sp.]HET8859052.1 thioredoxin fold domain-containing protein [Marivirga sp.]